MTVFEASLAKPQDALTAAQVRALIRRARSMRDQVQDLLRRQRVVTRSRTGSKVGTDGTANERTARKAQALTEAVARFERRLSQLDAADTPPKSAPTASRRATVETAPRTASKRATKAVVSAAPATKAQPAGRAPVRSAKAPATAPKRSGSGVPAVSSGADRKGMVQQRKFTGSQAIQAHVGARARRTQAKRDTR